MNDKQLKKLTDFISDLIQPTTGKSPTVTMTPFTIPVKTHRFIVESLPNNYLQFSALVYLYFYDSFPQIDTFECRNSAFQTGLEGYSEVNRQLFLISTIVNDQMVNALNDEFATDYFSPRITKASADVKASDGQILVSGLDAQEEQSDSKIKVQIEQFANDLQKEVTPKTKQLLAYVSLISTVGSQYAYLIHCDYTAKEMTMFQTKEKRKNEKEIIAEFAKAASSKGLKFRCFEDFQRNRIFSEFTEVFLWYLVHNLMNKQNSFIDCLRELNYCMFEFLPEEGDEQMIGGLEGHEDGELIEDISSAGGHSELNRPGQKANAQRAAFTTNQNQKKEKKDTDFDDDDFNDLNFDDEDAAFQDDF